MLKNFTFIFWEKILDSIFMNCLKCNEINIFKVSYNLRNILRPKEYPNTIDFFILLSLTIFFPLISLQRVG